MSFEEIVAGIESLAKSQGFYGRLLESLNELDDEGRAEIKAYWESFHFKDMVDFVIAIEG